MSSWSWEPKYEDCVFMDMETQSAANLTQVGSKAYLRHPTTRILSAVFLHGDTVVVWAVAGRYPGRQLTRDIKTGDLWPEGIERGSYKLVFDDGPDVPLQVMDWVNSNKVFVAHNASFDREAWRIAVRDHVGGDPVAWHDTIPACRASGLPAGLDALGKELVGEGKDKGKDALKLLYTVQVKGGVPRYPVGTVPLWRNMLRYNVKDVLLLREVFVHTVRGQEAAVQQADAAINERGLHFDRPFLNRLLELWAQAQSAIASDVSEVTNGELGEHNIKSVQQVKAWLKRQGFAVDSLNRQQLEEFYEDPSQFIGECEDVPPEKSRLVVKVLRLRQAATRASVGKLRRVLESADADDRVRDVFVYHGAHTGRWTGRGFQPHNMPRGLPDLDVEGLVAGAGTALTLDRVREAAGRCSPAASLDDAMATLIRPVFTAGAGNKLCVVDYAQVEARCVAWIFGEKFLLDAFADPSRDVYKEMAAKIFGVDVAAVNKTQRFVGKTTVLGCGYGMSAHKFGAICDLKRFDLAAAGTSAEACVNSYRDSCPMIAGYKSGQWRRGGGWKELQAAAMCAVQARDKAYAGKCEFFMRAADLVMRLPSGREVIYRGASVQDRVPGYCVLLGLPAVPRPSLVYRHHRGYEAGLYGGLLAENVCQAICRDFLAESLPSLEYWNLPVVFHAHDEAVSEVYATCANDALEKMAMIMSTPPKWASDFPLAVEGFTCERYVKSPFSTSHKVTALRGKIV